MLPNVSSRRGSAPRCRAARCPGWPQRRERHAVAELHLVDLALAPDGEAQPFGKCVHHRYAYAMQPAGNLVAVRVELAAGVQLRHHDFRGRALELVVLLDAGRNAAPVVEDRNRVVGVHGDDDLVAKPASASSTALSTTSNTMWCSPVPSEVSPMYIPGRLRTASRPFRTLIASEPYSCSASLNLDPHRHDNVFEVLSEG